MLEGHDIVTLLILGAIIVLVIWYFWHATTAIVLGARRIAEIFDGAAERQRAELEYVAKHGPRPLWYRAAQKVILAVTFTGAAWLIWRKLQG